MSLVTWKEEFYPTPARKMSELKATEHSLQKWRGLLPENLLKHGVVSVDGRKRKNVYPLRGRSLDDDDKATVPFEINSSTCSLCENHRDYDEDFSLDCEHCILYSVRGMACDEIEDVDDLDQQSPYHLFIYDADPKPMIELLELGLERLKENQSV